MASYLELEKVLDKVPAKDRQFASDLVYKARKYKGATAGQQKWIDILYDRAVNPQDEVEVVGDVGDFSGVYKLFAKAKEHHKYPKLHLSLENGMPLVLSMAGERSSAPGQINATDGGPYGNNKWYGRINPKGEWKPGRDFPELGEVAKLLRALGKNPEEVASKYGKMTGYCCFCHRKLEDEKSVAVGYGPVCAVKWGLKAEYKAGKGLFSGLVKEVA